MALFLCGKIIIISHLLLVFKWFKLVMRDLFVKQRGNL